MQTLEPREGLPTLYVFNSFFFQKLTENDTSYKHSRVAFERVKNWTKEIPISRKITLYGVYIMNVGTTHAYDGNIIKKYNRFKMFLNWSSTYFLFVYYVLCNLQIK